MAIPASEKAFAQTDYDHKWWAVLIQSRIEKHDTVVIKANLLEKFKSHSKILGGEKMTDVARKFSNARKDEFAVFDLRNEKAANIIAKEVARAVIVDVLAWQKATSQFPLDATGHHQAEKPILTVENKVVLKKKNEDVHMSDSECSMGLE